MVFLNPDSDQSPSQPVSTDIFVDGESRESAQEAIGRIASIESVEGKPRLVATHPEQGFSPQAVQYLDDLRTAFKNAKEEVLSSRDRYIGAEFNGQPIGKFIDGVDMSALKRYEYSYIKEFINYMYVLLGVIQDEHLEPKHREGTPVRRQPRHRARQHYEGPVRARLDRQ